MLRRLIQCVVPVWPGMGMDDVYRKGQNHIHFGIGCAGFFAEGEMKPEAYTRRPYDRNSKGNP